MNVAKISKKLQIKWKFELTVFELTVPDLYCWGWFHVPVNVAVCGFFWLSFSSFGVGFTYFSLWVISYSILSTLNSDTSSAVCEITDA